jgi:hypothetical protein
VIYRYPVPHLVAPKPGGLRQRVGIPGHFSRGVKPKVYNARQIRAR